MPSHLKHEIHWERLDPPGTFSLVISQPTIVLIVLFLLHEISSSSAVLVLMTVVGILVIAVTVFVLTCRRDEKILLQRELIHVGVAPILELAWALSLDAPPKSHFQTLLGLFKARSHFKATPKEIESVLVEEVDLGFRVRLRIRGSNDHLVRFADASAAESVSSAICKWLIANRSNASGVEMLSNTDI